MWDYWAGWLRLAGIARNMGLVGKCSLLGTQRLRSCVLYHVAVNSLHMLDEEPNKQMRYYNSCQPCLSRN